MKNLDSVTAKAFWVLFFVSAICATLLPIAAFVGVVLWLMERFV